MDELGKVLGDSIRPKNKKMYTLSVPSLPDFLEQVQVGLSFCPKAGSVRLSYVVG